MVAGAVHDRLDSYEGAGSFAIIEDAVEQHTVGLGRNTKNITVSKEARGEIKRS